MTYWNAYYIWAVLFPILIIVILLGICSLVQRKMLTSGYSALVSLTPMLALGIAVVIFLASSFSGFQYPLGAIFDRNKTPYMTVGRVRDVRPGPAFPYYLTPDGDWTTGQFAEVNGSSYFIPYPQMEPGQWVELHFAYQGRTVFQCSLLNEEEGAAKEVTDLPQPIQITPFNPRLHRIGEWLYYGGLLALLAVVVDRFLFRKKERQFFQQQDLLYQGGIQRNPVGFAEGCVIPICVTATLIGSCLTGNIPSLILGILICSVWGYIMFAKFTSSILLQGDQLIYRRFRKVRVIPASSVRSITWEYVGRVGDYSLVIVLNTGERLIWEQRYYRGLHDFAKRMEPLIRKRSKS